MPVPVFQRVGWATTCAESLQFPWAKVGASQEGSSEEPGYLARGQSRKQSLLPSGIFHFHLTGESQLARPTV